MPKLPTIASRLRAIRSDRELDQEDLARMAKAGLKAYGRWERGETQPRAIHIANLCEALGVSADYLIGRVDTECGLTPATWVADLDGVKRPVEVPARPTIVDRETAEQLKGGPKPPREKASRSREA